MNSSGPPAPVRSGKDMYTELVGFNPHHQHKQSRADIVIVIAALVICAALVAWGFLA